MTDLSGRELDRAICEALGWKDASWEMQYLPRNPNVQCWERPDGTFRHDAACHFHASVDALREVTPKKLVIEIEIDCNGETIVDFHPLPWKKDNFQRSIGKDLPEAWSRALLAWLTREKKA